MKNIKLRQQNEITLKIIKSCEINYKANLIQFFIKDKYCLFNIWLANHYYNNSIILKNNMRLNFLAKIITIVY